jgi:gas vesicle protein GvpL/GvpF/Lsr2 protein
MTTHTRTMLICDICGNAKDVQTQKFGLDDKAYEIDLCPKDGKGLSNAAAGYVSRARKVTAKRSAQHNGRRPRPQAETAAIRNGAKAPGRKSSGRGRATGRSQKAAKPSQPGQQAAKPSGGNAEAAGAKKEAKAGRSKQRKAEAASKLAAKATSVRQEKGIYVYGILPGDIEVAGDMPGVGDFGLLRVVCWNGLAALISEVDLSRRLGAPDDRRTHREILDATAAEVPVLPLDFGTVLAGEDAVTEELLAAHHDEFADALHRLEGRAEFLVRGRYVEEAVLDEILSENKRAARLQDQIQGKDRDAAGDARTEFGEIFNEAVAAKREEDTRALGEAMEGHCVASVAREPAHELEAVHVAFLVAADEEGEVERVIEDLAREWAGWIEVQLLGPMAAYDFVGTAKPEG